jgi:hypothetical protein
LLNRDSRLYDFLLTKEPLFYTFFKIYTLPQPRFFMLFYLTAKAALYMPYFLTAAFFCAFQTPPFSAFLPHRPRPYFMRANTLTTPFF